MTSNEIRQIVGMKPSDDPKADELRNSNISHPDDNSNPEVIEKEPKEKKEGDKIQNGV